MKCKICGKRAVIKIRAHNIALCKEDFIEFFKKRVEKAIRTYRMFRKKDRILVAVSGGKDSTSLWDVLINLGYNAEGLHIDLGINGYSEKSREVVMNFSKDKGLTLHIVSVSDVIGFSIPYASKKLRRIPCSICGLVKRYIMNKFCLDEGFDVIATGHNLDDEAATLLGNLLKGEWGYIGRQYPVLPGRDGFAKKVKPLVLLSEREVAAYALLSGINYLDEECPYSKGATSITQKEAINLIERRSPGTKLRFIQSFFKERGKPEDVALKRCRICGYPTGNEDVCSLCRLKERLNSS